MPESPRLRDRLRAAARRVRSRSFVTTVLELVGLGVCAFGVGLVYRPAGFIAAGLAMVAAGYFGSDTSTDSKMVFAVLDELRRQGKL